MEQKKTSTIPLRRFHRAQAYHTVYHKHVVREGEEGEQHWDRDEAREGTCRAANHRHLTPCRIPLIELALREEAE